LEISIEIVHPKYLEASGVLGRRTTGLLLLGVLEVQTTSRFLLANSIRFIPRHTSEFSIF
jgi:hypothetical protein